ncbi:Bacterial SH3 domain protein [Flavobacterium columnare]|uniref:Bacterial SH3 domain protein n=2 Tax=Flavobacterium TaxID=237 RepID=A0A2N9PC90_9FLAO|nr:SH3 domain-containing protein [Flavobacterium columnare]RVU90361.1 SH3 domain-containing protein [Flavobacterium columnare]SPE77972.1 Bacterial SH3 domain protein [Flavobacterium columnare]
MKKLIYILCIVTNISCKNENDTKKIEVNPKETIENTDKTSNNNLEMNNNLISFGEIFEEGMTKFSAKEIEKPFTEEQKEFKIKLNKFESQNKNFEPDNLLRLINDKTFEHREYSIDSEWFNYFVKKYNLQNNLKKPLESAINQEDLNVVKIILKYDYKISKQELKLASESYENYLSNKRIIDENNGIGEDGEPIPYEIKNSRATEILSLLKKEYNYHIYDKDGSCNLRDDAMSAGFIIGQVKSGEHIDIINNENQDWLYIKTKDNKEGYVHKSRIVSK